MEVQTFSYRGGDWSGPFPDLDAASTLVLAFGARRLDDDDVWRTDLRNRFPSACLVGCSTSGEILGDCLLDDSVSVAVARFDRTELRRATVSVGDHATSEQAGQALAAQLAAPNLAAVLVFSEGTGTNGSGLVAGLQSTLGTSVPLSGGLAGDGDRFERSWVLGGDDDGDRIGSDLIAAVGLYGDHVVTGHGSRGGWFPFGPERTVTRSEGNVLYELDGRPALPLYRSYLGDLADGLPASALFFPLCVRPPDDSADPIVRTVLAVDTALDTMTFAGDLPVGWRAQLMMANPEDLIEGAGAAADQCRRADDAVDTGDNADTLAIGVSCVGRRLVLGGATDDELMAVVDGLGSSTRLVGFYSYGEISPASGACELHNQTMTITTIREADE